MILERIKAKYIDEMVLKLVEIGYSGSGIEGYLRYLCYFCGVIVRTLSYTKEIREEYKDINIQINLHTKGTNKYKHNDIANKTFNKLVNNNKAKNHKSNTGSSNKYKYNKRNKKYNK